MYNVDGVIQYLLNTKYYGFRSLHGDLYNIAFIGYLKAKKNYKSEYGKMSMKYGRIYMVAEIQKYLYHERKHTENMGSIEVWHEPIITPNNGLEIDRERATKKIICELDNLTDRESLVIKNIYLGSGLIKDTALAKDLGISKQAIHKTKQNALNKLRESFKEYTYDR